MPRPRIWNLTIVLLAEDIKSIESALKAGHGATRHRLTIKGSLRGVLYTKQAPPVTPKWVRFLEDRPSPPVLLKNRSTSAVLFIPCEGRLFAVVFGHGRHLLRPGTLEEQFGLKVTLNSIDPRKIRSIDLKKFEAVTRHTRTQTNREGSASDFGLDVEQDLVRAVTGQPLRPELGNRLTGMDALVAAARVDLATLPELLGMYLERAQADDYKANFGWVDHIAEVRDPSVQARLNDALIARLKAEELDKLWLAPPEIVDWSQVSKFTYQGRRESFTDLHMREFLASVPDRDALSIDLLKRRAVRALDAEEQHVRYSWSVLQCVYFEYELGDGTYVLASGKWYRIASSFLDDVNDAVSRVTESQSILPTFDAANDRTEPRYNQRAATSSGGTLALLDKRVVYYGGGQIEICDLLSLSREFIHVKRYSGSSAPLSHLFSQGINSAMSWIGDAAYRRLVNERLPAAFQLADVDARPTASDFTVVFAIVSRSASAIDKSLPFFSRLSLRYAIKHLETVGFKVKLTKIGVR